MHQLFTLEQSTELLPYKGKFNWRAPIREKLSQVVLYYSLWHNCTVVKNLKPKYIPERQEHAIHHARSHGHSDIISIIDDPVILFLYHEKQNIRNVKNSY